MKRTIPTRQFRQFDIDVGERQQGEGGDRYPISFSSEVPVLRQSWEGPYYEVLSHAPGDIILDRAERGLPALKSHERVLHFGSVTGIRLDEVVKRLKGLLGFSSTDLGQEQKTLVDEGHLHTVSVGYRVHGMEFLSKNAEGVPTFLVRPWEPFEISTEPVPADYEVGFGRSDTAGRVKVGADDVVVIEVRDSTTGTGGEDMGETITERGTVETPTDVVNPTTPRIETRGEPTSPPTPVTPTRDRGAEAAEIMELCATHGFAERAADFVREGATPDRVRQFILEQITTKGPGQPGSESLDLPKRDVSRYSLQRALRIAAEMEKPNGIEAEVDQELRKTRTTSDHGGILVPWRFGTEQRALGTGEATGGATLVGETVMPEMIDILRNKALVLQAGARLYPGLQGVVHFNKKTGEPTVYWMQENPAADVTASQPTYGYVDLTPKTLIGSVEIPRQLLVMASIDVEADIRSDLGTGHALAVDSKALHGTGTANEPVGIYSAADVQSATITGVPDLPETSAMIGKLADANADLGSVSWMTTPLLAEVCTRVEKASGYPVYLWNGPLQEGTMLGYTARATNQVSKSLGSGSDEHGLIFGNWNDLVVGLWGNDLEIVVDVVTKAKRGQIVITSYSMADIALRRGQSFVKATGAKIA